MQRTIVEELPKKIGEKVRIQGWVQAVRKLGEISFVVLRERTGTVQVVLGGTIQPSPESVVEIIGEVKKEPRAKGGIEIKPAELRIISQVQETLPVQLTKKADLTLPTLMKYRPITLRMEHQAAIFKVQAELLHAFAQHMRSEGFTQISSTKLTSGGLEGGSEMFEVEYFGQKAYLAQSPQFYKQMMVGVFERVFEIGKVYRAEPSATTRHLAEYVGLDVEMGFIESMEEIMAMEERMLRHVFEHIGRTCHKELALHGASVPQISAIPRIPLAEALRMIREEYGETAEEELTPEAERQIGELVKKKFGSELVFVTKYPLAKRPFYTMPSTEPGCSESFDLLFRGMEITTGGQRIHRYEQLVEAMKAKGLRPEQFESYLMCFKYGMPPHGGIGIGAERVVKQLLGLGSVEEASLIPRTKERFLH